MNGLPYYRAYPRDFVEGTVGMPFELKGAYRLLIDLIYMQDGALPDDARYISGLLGCSVRKWNSYREKLISTGKIKAENDIISNFRADKELVISRTLSDKQSQNRSRPNKINGLQSPNTNHTDTYTEEVKEVSKDTSKKSIHIAFGNYNRMAERTGLPQAQFLTAKRASAIKQRLKEAGGLEGFNHALALVEANPFFAGDNPRGWKADLDFIITQSKFTKIMEGSYAKARPIDKPGTGTDLKRKLAEQHQRLFPSGPQVTKPVNG
jgi:uncharacterized protein YdaU (DUF1376 family)